MAQAQQQEAQTHHSAWGNWQAPWAPGEKQRLTFLGGAFATTCGWLWPSGGDLMFWTLSWHWTKVPKGLRHDWRITSSSFWFETLSALDVNYMLLIILVNSEWYSLKVLHVVYLFPHWTCLRAIVMKVERLCISHSINDLEFRFPVEPLPSQLRIVAAATEAMEKSTVALLESPTGTGKILGSGNVASCQAHDVYMIEGAFMTM